MGGYLIDLFAYIAIICITVLGLYITVMSGQWSICHAGLMGVGAYASAILTKNFGIPYFMAVILGACLCAVAGALISLVCLRSRHLYLAIITLAFGQVIVIVALNTGYVGGAIGFTNVPIKTTFSAIVVVFFAVLMATYALDHSRLGLLIRAVKDDPEAASSVGINISSMKVIAFALGSFVAGISGGLFAHWYGLVEPTDLSFHRSFELFIFVVIGGSESLWGVLCGALLLKLIPEILRFSIYDRYLMYGVIIVLVMIFRPNGLIHRRPMRVK